MKGVLSMRKGERQDSGTIQMAVGVLLGGLLALGVEIVILLFGAVAISNGIIKQDATLQLTAAACVVGGVIGGKLACAWWPVKKLLAGLTAGLVCFLLILMVGMLSGDGLTLGLQALIELTGCLCGGAISGLISGGKKRRKKGNRRSR